MPVAGVLNQVNRLLHFHFNPISSAPDLLWLFQKQTQTQSTCHQVEVIHRHGEVAVIV